MCNDPDDYTPFEQEKAEFITRACNSYTELLAAVRYAMSFLEEVLAHCGPGSTADAVLRRAIAAAGGHSQYASEPIYSHLQVEAALCLWEEVIDRTASARDGKHADIIAYRGRTGTVELRHACIPLADYCLKVHDLLPEVAKDGFLHVEEGRPIKELVDEAINDLLIKKGQGRSVTS